MVKFYDGVHMVREPLQIRESRVRFVFFVMLSFVGICTIAYFAEELEIPTLFAMPTRAINAHLPSSSSPISDTPISNDPPIDSSTSLGSSPSLEKRFINPMVANGFVKCQEDMEVTNLQLVMTWSSGFCSTSEKCWPEVEMTKFYIHGLWPADDAGRTKQACHIPFKTSNVPLHLLTYAIMGLGVELTQQLHEGWPSYQRTLRSQNQYQDSPKFWLHEYLRHGSCADMSVIDYFQRTLQRAGTLELEKKLSDAGMLEESTYSYSINMFSRAFSPVIGNKRFYLSCSENNRLVEINFCLDNEAREFISCPYTEKKFKCTGSRVTFHTRQTF